MLHQAAVVSYVQEARHRHGDSLAVLRRDATAWDGLVRKVEAVFWSQPLWRLQRIGAQSLDFPYTNCPIDTRVKAIELLPGVAYCLRQFHALITALVHGAWAEFVRKCNREALADTSELTEFLFGSERVEPRPTAADLGGPPG